jgi:diguanylate cyclase (GGDEF)-like protein
VNRFALVSGSAGQMLREQKVRVLRIYLAATTFLYFVGVFLNRISPRSDELANPTGGIIAVVLGVGALIYVAFVHARLAPAIVAAMVATPVVIAFHDSVLYDFPCLIAVMFLAMYIRAFYPPRRAWMMVIFLTAATCVALAIGPAHKLGITYAIFAIAIVGAAESFGLVTRSLVTIACTDPLTGVLNRAGWEIATTEQLARARSAHATITVAVLDIDDFKNVNDSLGHQAGDQRLIEYAQRWSSVIPKGAVLARLGGDEFALLITGTEQTSASDIIEQLRSAVPEASVGFAAGDARATTISDLLEQADAALYDAKRGR